MKKLTFPFLFQLFQLFSFYFSFSLSLTELSSKPSPIYRKQYPDPKWMHVATSPVVGQERSGGDFAFLHNRGDPVFVRSQRDNSGFQSLVHILYHSRSSVNMKSGSGIGPASAVYTYQTLTLEEPGFEGLKSFGFGQSLALGRNGRDVTNQLFVGTVSSKTRQGYVYFYEGEYSTWSVQQKIYPLSEYQNEKNFFGSQIELDRFESRSLAIGCKYCNSSGWGTGSVYIYEQSKMEPKLWSQQQQISAPAAYRFGGQNIKFHHDTLIADYWTEKTESLINSLRSYLVYKRNPVTRKFEKIQSLTVPFCNITGAAIFDDTIVFAVNNQNINGIYRAGAVYVLNPTTELIGPKKVPRTQWSIQQVLHGELLDYSQFGLDISIDRNSIAIAEYGSFRSKVYVFDRLSKYGAWSNQQNVTVVDAYYSRIDGSAIGIYNSHERIVDYYDEFQESYCLVVSLEDHFGDGWDIARLVVEAPDGSMESYESRCDVRNPYQIRYCPKFKKDVGVYSFAIKNGPVAKHYWEILYRIFDEATAKWYVGDINTRFKFTWDTFQYKFELLKADNLLPLNITCTPCQTRPTSKPTSPFPDPPIPKPQDPHESHDPDESHDPHEPHDPHRALKNDFKHHAPRTHVPTVSPAPTLAVTDIFVNWRQMRIETATIHDWFMEDHRGSYYYVSDEKNHKLLAKGTLCPHEPHIKNCWVDLPDGIYTVRVGGFLTPKHVHFQWYFCKSANYIEALTQLVIQVKDDDCEVIAYHNRATYCRNIVNYDPATIIAIEFLMNGNEINILHSLSDASDADQMALREAIQVLLSKYVPSVDDIEVLEMSPSTFGGTIVRIQITFRQSIVGYKIVEAEDLTSFNSLIFSIFSTTGIRDLMVNFQSTSKKSVFTTVSSLTFMSSSIKTAKDFVTIDPTNPLSNYGFVNGENGQGEMKAAKFGDTSEMVVDLAKDIHFETEIINVKFDETKTTAFHTAVLGYLVTGSIFIFLIVGYIYQTSLKSVIEKFQDSELSSLLTVSIEVDDEESVIQQIEEDNELSKTLQQLLESEKISSLIELQELVKQEDSNSHEVKDSSFQAVPVL